MAQGAWSDQSLPDHVLEAPRMTAVFNITLTVSVSDPQALWTKAKDHLLSTDPNFGSAYLEQIIGTQTEPDAGACLTMLLDRSEHLDGAEIEHTEIEENP